MRRVPRFPVNLDVNLLSGPDTKKGVITNLGLKGAFVTMPAPAQVNPLVTMRFAPPQVPQSMEVLARVVRSTAHGFGAEFLDLDPQNVDQLWSSLATLWPKELKDCPYCASTWFPSGGAVPCVTCPWIFSRRVIWIACPRTITASGK